MGSEIDLLAAFSFEAEVIYWRGPSPFFFAPLPAHLADACRRSARLVSYGWGMLPVEASIGAVMFQTSLFPRDDTYLTPIKTAVRRKANVTAGDTVTIEMKLRLPKR